MTTHCFIPMLGKRMRVTQMTGGGAVGANYIATDGFISVNLTSEVEDGTEIVQRNAAGQLCVNERMASSFKRFNVEAEFCGVNPSLLSYVTNAVEYEDYAGDIAGFTVPEGEITGAFSLELWTGLSGAIADNAASGYFLLPFVQKGTLGDITIDGENAITFSLSGSYTMGGNAWGVGPYNVLMNESTAASKLPTALDDLDHLLVIDTAVAPPPSACSPTAVTA
jgi:hypothetical protein